MFCSLGNILKEERMAHQKPGEEAIIISRGFNETTEINREGDKDFDDQSSQGGLKSFLWHGGSAYDAWFSCASNQVSPFIFLKPNNYTSVIF